MLLDGGYAGTPPMTLSEHATVSDAYAALDLLAMRMVATVSPNEMMI